MATLPAQAHSPTSIDAAEQAARRAPAQRERILTALRCFGSYGATDEELQEACDLAGNTERPRRTELVAAGLVVDSEQTRRTHSGRHAVVWVAANVVCGTQLELLPVRARKT